MLKSTLFYVTIFVIMCLFSCSSTREMQVLVTKPPLFELPTDVKKILLVNRSKGNAVTVLEGVLTGELPGTDKNLSEQCLSAVFQTLMLNKSLSIMRHDKILSSSKGSSSSFGGSLEWGKVEDLATQYNADAILMLEFFDSDYFVRDVIGYNSLPGVIVRGNASATAGFRLYYPKKQSILYEKEFRSSQFYQENSTTKLLALAKLIKGSDALQDVSFRTGQRFARRITKYNIWEDRLMYKGKKNTEMQRGERLVIANNWQQGVDSWLKAYTASTNTTEKGKIAYNLALGYEVLGNLEEAKKWITTAYVDGGDKKALNYSTIINQRIENEGVLSEK